MYCAERAMDLQQKRSDDRRHNFVNIRAEACALHGGLIPNYERPEIYTDFEAEIHWLIEFIFQSLAIYLPALINPSNNQSRCFSPIGMTSTGSILYTHTERIPQ